MVIRAQSALKASISLALFVISTLWPCFGASAVQEPPPIWRADSKREHTDYQRWIDKFARKDFTKSAASGEATQLKLVVTVAEEMEREKSKEHQIRIGSGISLFGAEISTDGCAWNFSRTDLGSKGWGGSKPIFSPEDLKRLDELLAMLPKDGARLPPPGRRMILQAVVSQHLVTRVYDLANSPDVVWKILRLIHGGIGSWVPEFKPQSEIDAHGYEHGGFFCLSPDGLQMLFTEVNGPLQLWDPITHEFLAEIPLRGGLENGVAFSPDGSMAVIGSTECICLDTKTWKVIKKLPELHKENATYVLTPQFTHNGRYLLLQNSKYPLQIYDVRTWQRVDRLPQVPEDAVQYILSPKGKQALIRKQTGVLALWDVINHRQIAVLDNDAYIEHACFAPDDSRVVATTVQPNVSTGYHSRSQIRVWTTKKGKLLHELRSHEQSESESVEGLSWSPDGRYVLAVIEPYGFFTSRSICVFNVSTGHHRGSFEGCPSTVTGMALLPDGKQLVAGCQDGRIRFWDFETGMKKIKAFEASLAPPP